MLQSTTPIVRNILYVCGITPDAPAPLRPLPPLDSGAPHGNIFRLVEHLAQRSDTQHLHITVLSAISPEQVDRMKETWPAGSLHGDYRWSVIGSHLRSASAVLLKHAPWSAALLRRTLGAHSLQARAYVREVRRLCRQLAPDWVLLDDAPQYIRLFARFVPPERLAFYCRGDMGESRRFLHLPALLLTTNAQLGEWMRQVNPQVARYAIVRNSLPPLFLKSTWAPRRFHMPPPIVLFVGRVTPVKGLHYLVQAFARVHALCPGARLVVVGAEHPGQSNGSHAATDYEREVRRQADALLPGLVEWKGWLPSEALMEEYGRAYAAVYPATWIEGFGMVAAEAMAFGVPVIASNRPGFQSLLGQGGGLLVDDPTDTSALAEAIVRLLQDPALAERLGRQGYEIAREYTVERAAQEFAAAVQAILSTAGGH